MVLARAALLLAAVSGAGQAWAVTPEEALAMKVPLGFKQVPVEDFIDYLKVYCRVEIELHDRARARSLPPVTANYRNVPLREVLGKVLADSELTFEVLPDRIVVGKLNPDLPLSETGYLLNRQEALEGWISLFDGRTTFGWVGATEFAGSLEKGTTTTALGDYEIVARLNDSGVLELGGEKVLAKPGILRKEVRGKAAPIRLLEKTSVQMIRIRPLGIKALFNGKDLTGWQRIDRKGLADEKRPVWRVEEGAIRAIGGPGALEHPELYGDFVLQIDVRTRAAHANGGLFFRSRPGDFMNGYEAQIYNRCEENDPARPSVWSTGSIDDRQLARRLVSRDFVPFRMTVVAHGPHIATWVNGHQLVDWTDTRPAHDNPRQGLRLEPGTLQLQAHDPQTDVEFLGISIAPLKP